MAEDIDRSAALIERLLGEPELRRRFLSDPAAVLSEHGLGELAGDLGHGKRALRTLELRESRSSLAGVMVAAAAEAVDFAHVVERATPGILHDAGRALDNINSGSRGHAHHAAASPRAASPGRSPGTPATPAAAATAAPGPMPPMAQPVPQSAPVPHSAPVPGAASSSGGAAVNGAGTPTSAPSGQRAPAAAAVTGRGHLGPEHREGVLAASDPTAAHAHSTSGGAGLDAAAPTPAPSPLTYPGDTASPQQIAAWMGANAVKAGLPAELPVMAALTESGMRNLSYGDRDSVGFFQMRLGIWNEGPYTGYQANPQLQIQWFIDHALAVKAQYPGLAENPSTWGELVANVEQPAAEYRYRYQLQLATAQALLHGADLTPAPPAPPVPLGQAALKVALAQLQSDGSGASAGSGTDSAGLVQLAFAHEGVQLPREAVAQFDVGAPVGRDQLKLGDAVFFKDHTGFIDQVGLYVGSGRFITAPDAGGPARILALSDPAFASAFAGARRFTLGALGDLKSYARPLPTLGG